MTNTLVGDVYAKIIQEVIEASKGDFDEHGISSATLDEMQKEWQAKLSQRAVALMPWDPKPPQPQAQQSTPSLPPTANGPAPSNYGGYSSQPNGNTRVKNENGTDSPYMPNGSAQDPTNQGGLARAQQLVQAYPAQRGGLALPGQRPQGLQLPGQSQQPTPQQYSAQQRQQIMMQQQQQQQQQQQAALQSQQGHNRIKVENGSPKFDQSSFQQQQHQPNPSYAQTDGADDGLEEWQTLLAQRRAANAQHGQHADRLMREQAMQVSSDLQSGLMVPLGEQPNRMLNKKRRTDVPQHGNSAAAGPSIPQLDGDVDDEEEKQDIKDEDDENAINSDLDDSDDEGLAAIGEEEDDLGDSILCTYDKVQRVKNKWKCTLKDGVMSVSGKEWVFHKGTGEFEW